MISQQEIERVVKQYSDSLLRLALHHVHETAQAQDIVQDVFLQYIKHNESFANMQHEKAWLFRVTINQCKKYHLHWWQKKRSEFPISAAIEKKEIEYSLLAEIRKLPGKQSNAIYFYYYEEMSIKEIAGMLHTKEGTVASWLSRGRKNLKQRLEKGGKLE